ncbi:MAG: tryptophan--tRNA ligase [Desulfobacterales bacterium]
MAKIALTGIKPTGTPHIGNYLGMIKPAIELVQSFRALYFIADYHALTTERDPEKLNCQTYEVAATWLALGLDPDKVVFFRQSDIPEVFELTWILACLTSKGLLNRAHAYKTAVEENIRQKRSADDNINAGIFGYPVLMAADILLFGTHVVPVGQDQKQHVEIARDIASSFNSNYGNVFTIPDVLVREDVMSVPGLDGRKMSKTYRNTIPIFADDKVIRRQVMGIVTDSKPPEAPKDPESCNLFSLYRYFAPREALMKTRAAYLKGARYNDIKKELVELLLDKFKEGRRTYEAFLQDKPAIERILKQGAETARSIAKPLLTKVRLRIGINRTEILQKP